MSKSFHVDENGFENNFGDPLVIPSKLRLPQSTDDRLRAILRSERFSQQMEALGDETFDEADDFSLPDGEIWLSPYEDQLDERPLPEGKNAPEGHAEQKPDPSTEITAAAKASVTTPDAS